MDDAGDPLYSRDTGGLDNVSNLFDDDDDDDVELIILDAYNAVSPTRRFSLVEEDSYNEENELIMERWLPFLLLPIEASIIYEY